MVHRINFKPLYSDFTNDNIEFEKKQVKALVSNITGMTKNTIIKEIFITSPH